MPPSVADSGMVGFVAPGGSSSTLRRSAGFYTRLLVLFILGVLPSLLVAASPHEGYVGSAVCADCHTDEATAWHDSHHDLAMQQPDESTVLGDFSDVTVSFGGVDYRFFRDGERFMINTPGPDGERGDYPVEYTFGVEPLQQYLLALPGGRLQAFGVAWDSRPAEQGGQRWFHLYPDDPPEPGDRLHWSGADQNWNHMCAECHSTDLHKRYDAASRSYATSYAEVDVGCEACHGPGAEHVDWANTENRDDDPRLAIRFDERDGVRWLVDPDTGTPRRSVARDTRKEIDTCARCHSRRGRLTEDYHHGMALGDSHRLALLQPGLYHPDGQILDEVFVHGSFLQSRMYDAGVSCGDCHDPHSLELHAEGDNACLSCHMADRYAVEEHHHHPPASEAARCVSCHMPATTYMVVDPRRDHSFRVPRPDLARDLGTPDVCSACHTNRDAAWAADVVRDWLGRDARGYQQHTGAFAHAEAGRPAARAALLTVAGDGQQSAIARASAIARLGDWLDQQVARAMVDWLEDPDPLVRRATVEALANAPPQVQAFLLPARLTDPVRTVRHAAAMALASVPVDALDPAVNAVLGEALADLRETLAHNADRPEAQLNLATLLTRLGNLDGAQRAYRQALRIEPGFVPASVNLAELLREMGRQDESDALLREALARTPDEAVLHHAHGLALIRQGQAAQALKALRRAAELEPDDARYGYVLAVALHDTGDPVAARRELDRVLARWPYHRDSLAAAVYWAREAGGEPRADYTARLLEWQRLAEGG